MDSSVLTLREFKGLFQSYYPSLCLFANSYLKDQEASKDAVQDVFIKIWEKRIEFENKNSAKAYLYKAVKNRCLDILKISHLKVINDTIEVESLEFVSEDSFFYKELMVIEISKAVEKAINSLHYKCAKIIDLRLKQYSNKEIADILSLSINTVKTQKKIAYQKLRPMLDKYYVFLILLLKM